MIHRRPYDAPMASDHAARTLYDELSEVAPLGLGAGETIGTRTKETLDNDEEAIAFEHDGSNHG